MKVLMNRLEYIESERKVFEKLEDVFTDNVNMNNPSEYLKGQEDGIKLALECFGHKWFQLDDIKFIKEWGSK